MAALEATAESPTAVEELGEDRCAGFRVRIAVLTFEDRFVVGAASCIEFTHVFTAEINGL
jgi:hypothetical protein